MIHLRSIFALGLFAIVGCGGRMFDEPVMDAGPDGSDSGLIVSQTREGGAFKPVRSLPCLDSISFYERTGGTMPMEYRFSVSGSELGARLPDPLSKGNADIEGAPTEYYDVYYSDQNGKFDIDGSYLTISGSFEMEQPWGGGLNLAEIVLHFTCGNGTEYGNYVASFVALGDNADPSSVGRCIDGNLLTHTTMGNTVGQNERLRLTLGFESSSGPPPK